LLIVIICEVELPRASTVSSVSVLEIVTVPVLADTKIPDPAVTVWTPRLTILIVAVVPVLVTLAPMYASVVADTFVKTLPPPSRFKEPPIVKLPPIPTPPSTTKAPVFVLVLCARLVIRSAFGTKPPRLEPMVAVVTISLPAE
jgi:hypothetical protein